jgi:hypothetical protein
MLDLPWVVDHSMCCWDATQAMRSTTVVTTLPSATKLADTPVQVATSSLPATVQVAKTPQGQTMFSWATWQELATPLAVTTYS